MRHKGFRISLADSSSQSITRYEQREGLDHENVWLRWLRYLEGMKGLSQLVAAPGICKESSEAYLETAAHRFGTPFEVSQPNFATTMTARQHVSGFPCGIVTIHAYLQCVR